MPRVCALLFRRLPAVCLTLMLAWAGTAAQAQPFSFEALSQLARERAALSYADPASPLPAELQQLDYDALRDIRFKPGQSLWRDKALPFETQFFHRGKYHPQPVRVNEVLPGGTVRALPFRPTDFDYGRNALDARAWDDLGHAGFRIHYPLNTDRYKDELTVFLGASYFRALGAGQQYGLSARGLALDTVGATGPEEFPRFAEFWLERPAHDATEVVVHALLESPRATGAYRFAIRPGTQTVMEVRARVFLRDGAPTVATLGLAPLTSMFLSGENQPRAGDFRPEVHDSDGLMLASASGEWLWRPLNRPATGVLVNSFAMDGLRGFGLMQRDRRFDSYEDLEARYERRPSAWVRPLGDWGPGRVELVQLSTPDETHDNIVAYWVPARLPASGEPLEFAYELSWQGDAQQRPPGGWTVQSRRGFGFVREGTDVSAQTQFIVDFAGPALDALDAGATVRGVASADANGRIEESNAYFNPATRTWRLALRVRAIDPARPVELRAFLQHGNDTLSETWTNIILPDAAR